MTRKNGQARDTVDPSPSTPGDQPPLKKPLGKRKLKKIIEIMLPETQPATPPDPVEYRPGNARQPIGRLASCVASRPVSWFIPDLVPKECLTMLIGPPDAGKSTCGAWMCSVAKRPAILPGYEESVEIMLRPRLEKNGVKLNQCLLLDGRPWQLPHDRQLITDTLIRHGADLLWVDPIDTYVSDCSENEGQGVREALESFARIATDVGCAVVAVRHPGKNPNNLCPGSRQWRAVPRVILQISVDDGPPIRRFMKMFRDPFGSGNKPREVHLEGFDRQPKVFRLGDLAKPSDVESASVSDVIERTMIDSAAELLKLLLANGEVESSNVYKHMEQERFKDRTVRLAARRLNVFIRREGSGLEHRSLWSLTDSGTPAHPESDTPKPKSRHRKKGVSQSECRSAGVPEPTKPQEVNNET